MNDQRPIAYVATGSHATYFSSGRHLGDAGACDDHADGDGEWVVPEVVDVTLPPGWLNWKGRWGGSDTSPEGPKFANSNGAIVVDDKWTDPLAWATSLGCTENQTSESSSNATQSAELSPPAVSAPIEDGAVVVSYSVTTEGTGASKPLTLVTAVKSAGPK